MTRSLGFVRGGFRLRLPPRLPDLPRRRSRPPMPNGPRWSAGSTSTLARRSRPRPGGAVLGLTKATRFVNVLEVGYANESQTGEKRQERLRNRDRAAVVRLGRRARRARRGHYRQALASRGGYRSSPRSEVRESYHTYRTAYDLAKRLSRRDRALAQAHRRRERAALQRDADWRVRAPGRRAGADRQRQCLLSRRPAISGSPIPRCNWRSPAGPRRRPAATAPAQPRSRPLAVRRSLNMRNHEHKPAEFSRLGRRRDARCRRGDPAGSPPACRRRR